MDDHGGPVSAQATRLTGAGPISGLCALPGRVALAEGDQGVGHALVEGGSITPVTTGSRSERTLHHRVLVLGEHPGHRPAPIVEAKEAPGVEARRPLVGL